MSAPTALERADRAGRLARELGVRLATLRAAESTLSRWHPLAIVAAGFAAGAICGRLFGRIAPGTAAASFMVPLGAWLQGMPQVALRAWVRRQRAARKAATGPGAGSPA